MGKEVRTTNIVLRVSEDEKQQIKDAAAECGFRSPTGDGNMSAYLLFLHRNKMKEITRRQSPSKNN